MDRLRRASRLVAALAHRHPLAMSLLAVSVFCAVSIAWIDRPLALALKGALTPHVEGFFKVVTELGEGVYLLVPAALAWGLLRWRAVRSRLESERARLLRYAHSAAFLFSAMAVSGLLANLLKFAIGRIRPRHLFDGDLYGFILFNIKWSMNSFPSGHSQAIWAAATALLFIFPRYDLAWVGIALVVSLSRMLTTVHYLSDVVFGTYIGIAVTILVKRWFEARAPVHIKLERDRRLV